MIDPLVAVTLLVAAALAIAYPPRYSSQLVGARWAVAFWVLWPPLALAWAIRALVWFWGLA